MKENKVETIENNGVKVDWIVYEGQQVRNERMIKRLFRIIIVLCALLLITNIGWIVHESLYETI